VPWTRLKGLGLILVGIAALAACPASAWGGPAVGLVRAKVETTPVRHAGDAADDVAVWVNPRRRAGSTIIGTDKDGGIAVYALSGRLIQYRPAGQMNNVDLRGGFPVGAGRVTLVAASNRSNDSIAIYRVAPRTRRLVDIRARMVGVGMNIYGLCMYRNPRTARYYVFVTSESGEVQQWRLFRRGNRVDARKVRSFQVGSVSEGCVADDLHRRLYVAEESTGIWRYGAEPGSGDARTLVDSTGSGGHLTADVEGLAIAKGPRGSGFLAASSQGSSTFVLYGRRTNAYVKTFRIVAGRRIDGVSDTDGIDVTTAGLGPLFPRGVFVAQDGDNGPARQNFKLVPWPAIPRS
jgi:3-phytase